VISPVFHVGNNALRFAQATCPAGYKATGGGFNLITHSGKVVQSSPGLTYWNVEVETGLLETADFQVEVICMKLS
jgi:hypothetical protein